MVTLYVYDVIGRHDPDDSGSIFLNRSNHERLRAREVCPPGEESEVAFGFPQAAEALRGREAPQ